MALTSLIVKNFEGISRVATVIASNCNLLSSSKVISRRLGLKILERYNECFGIFFIIASDPTPALFSNGQVL